MKLVILVLSAAKYEDRRQAVRETWAANLTSDKGIAVALFTGGGEPPYFESKLATPGERLFEVVSPCPDDYPSLPQKTRSAFAWALATFRDCQWFLKCDDDSYIHLPRLLEFVETNRAAYTGHPMHNEPPPFASGGAGYLLNRQAAEWIAENLTDATGPEDLLVCRSLMQAKIPFTPCERFHPWNTGAPRLDNDLISSHYQSPEMMRRLHATLFGQRIPRIFHWIWVGPNKMPEQFVRYMHGWIEKHPGWESRLWTNDTMPALANQREYDLAKTWAQKADIARYEILHRHGGVYLDVDFEARKNIEPLIDGLQAFAGAEDESSVAIGILGSVPGHPLFADLIRDLPASFAAHENIVNATGPGFFTRHCRDRQDFKIFPPWFFYPVRWDGRVYGPIEGAFAQHWWAHSWKTDSPAD